MQLGERMVLMLSADLAITDIVGDSIHPVKIPQGRNPPCIIYFEVLGRPIQTLSGPSLSRPARVQFSCFAQSYRLAHTLAAAVEANMGRRSVAGTTLETGPVVTSWTRHDLSAEYQPEWWHVVVDVQMLTLDS